MSDEEDGLDVLNIKPPQAVIAKPSRSKHSDRLYHSRRDEAVVEAVEVAPALVAGEDGSPRGGDDEGEEPGSEHEVDLRGLDLVAAHVDLEMANHHRGELVEPLTDRLEHDQAQGDPHHRASFGKPVPTLIGCSFHGALESYDSYSFFKRGTSNCGCSHVDG
ncbi:unnamed protein product [Bemisia tabaci]|uniref:Uncharacterized protein n=1 Tax=Bemisia tabaci TaxID=7038 RepID=A0A9P0A060_BEMTA|nr:unnamed protein product [Bemisia tabaci]